MREMLIELDVRLDSPRRSPRWVPLDEVIIDRDREFAPWDLLWKPKDGSVGGRIWDVWDYRGEELK